MTFRRSASALHSLHIFFRVDVVVYCEGGPSLTYAAATAPAVGGGTLDTLYWSSVISSYNLTKTFHFKSVGGKETINAIAREVSGLGISTITVCRDADYDYVLGRNLSSSRVARTRGYSWENDVLQLPVLENLVSALVGKGPDQAEIVKELRAKVAQFALDLQRWTEIDISLFVRGRGCVFDRDKPLAVIDMGELPRLRVGALSERLSSAGYQRRPRRAVAVAVGDVTTVCYGKLLSKALYHTFIGLLRRIPNLRIEYELFMRLAINETIKAMAAGQLPLFASHVQSQRGAFA